MSQERNRRILFLYAEVMGYTTSVLEALSKAGFELHVVSWDTRKLTPYQIPVIPNATFYPRSSLSAREISDLSVRLSPAITVVSGIQDKAYLRAALNLRRLGKIVVSGFDTKWKLSLKHVLASVAGKLKFFSLFFSHAWIPGPQQLEFVRKIGFQESRIISDLYAADVNLFAGQFSSTIAKKKKNYPHRFLFVGRFEQEKGLRDLAKAWSELSGTRGDWDILLVGNGSLRGSLENIPGLTVRDFMQPDELVSVICEVGCFLLPSRSEPWGVVVHEFAAAGLPLILSDEVGAASTFLIPGTNGYLFTAGDVESLRCAMEKIILQSDETLCRFGESSSELANKVSPESSARSLASLLA
jgi:glycosyltransferase involved in cell wall biosynthesis